MNIKNNIISLASMTREIIVTLLIGLMPVLAFSQGGTTTVTVKPTVDSYVESNTNAAINYGANTYLYASTLLSGGEATSRRSYVKADVSSIPAGSCILSATLKLYSGGYTAGTTIKTVLEKVTATWTETGVTWNNKPTVSTTNSVYINTPVVVGSYYSPDITRFVQDWLGSPSSNYGLSLRLQTETTGNGYTFYSSDYGTASMQPSLDIKYALTQPLQWYALNKLTVSTNYGLAKGLSTTASWDDMTATTLNELPALTDGFILHKVSTPVCTDKVRVGFSSGFETSADKMDFCFEVAGTTVDFYAFGTKLNTTSSTVSAGTQLWLKRVGTTIEYWVGTTKAYTYLKPCDANLVLRGKVACYKVSGSVAAEIGETAVSFGLPFTYNITPSNGNYIYSVIPRIAVTSIPTMSSARKGGDYAEQIDYFDGLGRPLQNISLCNSPSGASTILPHTYDALGREAIKYLPYTLKTGGEYASGSIDPNAINPSLPSDATKSQGKFYSAAGDPDIPDSQYPFVETIFEDSPLNRIIEQSAPGESWKINKVNGISNKTGHTIKSSFELNEQNDVYRFSVDPSGALLKLNFYEAKSLKISINRNENYSDVTFSSNKNTTKEYSNKEGKVVLKRTYDDQQNAINIYYVYDDFGLLRYVISPEGLSGVLSVPASTVSCSMDVIKNQCYYYEYDSRNRMVKKQLPGADMVYMVYDGRDRLVASQDGNLRDPNKDGNTTDAQWLFTQYDLFNRPVATGLLTNGIASQTTMQTNVTNRYTQSTPYAYYEDPTTTGTGYTNNSFPKTADGSNIKYLSYTFYDNYTYPGKIGFLPYDIIDYKDNDQNKTNGYYDRVKGQVTGTKVRVLDDLNAENWIVTTPYYDDNYRVIYTSTLCNATGCVIHGYSEQVATRYSFDGRPMIIKDKQLFNGVYTEVTKYNVYDAGARLVQLYSEVTGDATNGRVLESEMVYNELGQLKSKKLHKSTSGTALQDINLAYNIRGWVTQINDPESLTGSGTYADLFAEKLLYEDNTLISNLTTQKQYNGNICGIIYNRRNNDGTATTKSAYGFKYDVLNRLNDAIYAENTGSGYTVNLNAYNEFGITYDKNGNILSLKRNSAGTLVDNLTYTYLNSGASNQLQRVADAAANVTGFKDVTGSIDYTYDKNGNLTGDANREIILNSSAGTGIQYNFLNLPSVVTKDANNTTRYIYSSSGQKLVTIATVTVNISGTPTTTTTNRYYLGTFEYDNTKALSLIKMEEGIITKSTGGYTYEYALKDHLGNTRISFNATSSGPAVTQRTDYYAFGLAHENPYNGSTGNDYLYNGKESQKDLTGIIDWYDYGARFYDPQIGRFHTQDAFAEMYLDFSPYQYAANNPIKFIDVNGDSIWYTNSDGNIVYDAKINSQEEFEKSGIKGTYIGQTFVGRDQDDAMFSFNKDGSTKKSDVTATAASKAFSDKDDQENFLNSMVDVKSTLVDDGESKTAKASFGLAAVLVADDATVVGVVDDVVAAGAVVVGGIAVLAAGEAVYEFAHVKKKQSTGKSGSDSHAKQYRHGGKNRPENPNKRKGADRRRTKGQEID